ncbi:hypothetical protein CL652_02580 [bacterium]|nr:hypothetical protein [bacterium]|tara:strand:+ start:16880 stop:17401 length:522 start_codon:yes stop_codon:yes gene_type:complete
MIYLIGVDHYLQHDGNESAKPELRSAFKNFLKNEITALGVDVIAEEFNEDAIRWSMASHSTLGRLAEELRITHLYCEPTIQERKELEIPSYGQIKKTLGLSPTIPIEEEIRMVSEKQKEYFAPRENFWLNKLTPFLSDTVLFVLGSKHMDSFSSLLEQKAIDYVRRVEYWTNK